MIRAGEMRHLVRIEQRTTVQDAAGEPTATWNFFAERRAAIQRLPGHEVWSSQERSGRVPTVFRLRFIDGVLPAMRLTCNGKLYNILSAIDPDGHRAELVLTTEERVEETTT